MAQNEQSSSLREIATTIATSINPGTAANTVALAVVLWYVLPDMFSLPSNSATTRLENTIKEVVDKYNQNKSILADTSLEDELNKLELAVLELKERQIQGVNIAWTNLPSRVSHEKYIWTTARMHRRDVETVKSRLEKHHDREKREEMIELHDNYEPKTHCRHGPLATKTIDKQRQIVGGIVSAFYQRMFPESPSRDSSERNADLSGPEKIWVAGAQKTTGPRKEYYLPRGRNSKTFSSHLSDRVNLSEAVNVVDLSWWSLLSAFETRDGKHVGDKPAENVVEARTHKIQDDDRWRSRRRFL
ncbi:hypothetical protein EV421DRAFT_1968939 [Armillaria borealis]|uniref:Uncharacterized protein n=1 Tax=Armillaria borealis TaxID=47425 RepID=A0AA39N0I5_9AGAR|nr:hypothetical protein EV421DRAFT_1968939 [Armillaria borealis]